jgi:hypothetical protein
MLSNRYQFYSLWFDLILGEKQQISIYSLWFDLISGEHANHYITDASFFNPYK